jgi:hypothetical protein|tara:strand:- start:58 stop:483 length:426 start_codon:yes stop_codon:yes gene_type:complete
MFEKTYVDRIREWSAFRSTLETSAAPIQDAIDFYSQAPLVSMSCDPYADNLWPDPWELVYENVYCEFSLILGMCYTLQLTNRFLESTFEMYICADREKSKIIYLLYVDDLVIGHQQDRAVNKTQIPVHITVEKQFTPHKLR